MFTGQVIKRCLIPAATIAAEVKSKSGSSNEEEQMCCRPSELPIYTPESIRSNTPFKEEVPGLAAIEDAFRSVRLTLEKYNQEFQAYKQVGLDHFARSRENVEWVVDYLREENNTLPKAGAIGIGALTGLIFGLRGGLFKRTLYATTGALGMGAVCYPKEAAEYTEIGLTETKKYVTIAYNFIYGVKKDDPPLELPSLPKLPSSLSETWDVIKSSAASFVSDEKKQDEKSAEQVNKGPEVSHEVKDPLDVVTKSHNLAISKSCHCPIGGCLGHSDDSKQSPNSLETAD